DPAGKGRVRPHLARVDGVNVDKRVLNDGQAFEATLDRDADVVGALQRHVAIDLDVELHVNPIAYVVGPEVVHAQDAVDVPGRLEDLPAHLGRGGFPHQVPDVLHPDPNSGGDDPAA